MKYNRFLLLALLLSASTFILTSCGSSKATSPVNPIDTAPPAAPSSVSMSTDDGTSRDYLNWNASASSGVVSYQVFRFADASSTTNGELVATVAADQSSTLLPIVGADVIEFYRVRAVNSNDVASSYSSNCSADRTVWNNAGPNHDGGNGPDTKDDLN